MDQLPGDILGEIFGLLKWRNWALSLALTCKRFLEIWAMKPIDYVNFKYETQLSEGVRCSVVTATIYIFYGDNIIFSLNRWLTPLKEEWYLPHESFLVVSKVFNKFDFDVCIPSKNTKNINQEAFASESKASTVMIGPMGCVYCMDATLLEFQETKKRIIECIKNTPVEDKFGDLFDKISETSLYDSSGPRSALHDFMQLD